MTLTRRIRKQLAITLELVVEVEGEFREPDTEVGEFGTQVEDLTIHAIGTTRNEPEGMVDWVDLLNPKLGSPALEDWITGCIIEQSGDRLEEQLKESE